MRSFYLLLICCLLSAAAHSQSFFNQKKKKDSFLDKQWWIGLKAGTNLSRAIVTKHYSVVSPSNYQPELIYKEYEDFANAGSQGVLEITFYFRGLGISLQPTLRNARFVYTNYYRWADSEDANNRLELNYEQEQKIVHAVIPLLARYEFGATTLRPYVQGGFYTAFLINGNKGVNIRGVDYAAGGRNEFESEPIIVGAKDLFAKKHWGLVIGTGVNYNLGNIRLNLDIAYQYGMSNISSTRNRFSNDRLAGVGDALDDMRMNNLLISAGALFPLRFLENGFKSLNRK